MNKAMKEHFIVGRGGHPLIGTPERIVDSFAALVDISLDGMLLYWRNMRPVCAPSRRMVLSLMRQARLR